MLRTGLFTLPLLMALALALFTGPRAAVAQAPGWQPTPLLIAQKHRRPARQRVDRLKIACTKFGCIRIPLGCHPEIELRPRRHTHRLRNRDLPGKPPLYGNPE